MIAALLALFTAIAGVFKAALGIFSKRAERKNIQNEADARHYKDEANANRKIAEALADGRHSDDAVDRLRNGKF